MNLLFGRRVGVIVSPQTSGQVALRLLAGLLAVALCPASAKAGFVMSIGNYHQTSPLAGTFEVTLSNTDNTTYNVAGFNFEFMLPSSSGVQFTGATTATVAHSYIFNGTGSATVDPGFMFSYDTFPNTSFTASDTEFTYPSIAVAPGSSFGLGLVSYSISPNAPAGTVPIGFVALGTGLSDADGNAISFTTSGGSIQVQPASVPEPSSFILLTISTATLVAVRKCGRAGRPAPKDVS